MKAPGQNNQPMGMSAPIPGDGMEMNQNEDPGMGDMDMNTDMGLEDDTSKEGSEIDNVLAQLGTEEKAAVLKYAKSMIDDKPQTEAPQNENVDEDEIVTEITNNILDDRKDPMKAKDEKIRNTKITNSNPFITKNFSRK